MNIYVVGNVTQTQGESTADSARNQPKKDSEMALALTPLKETSWKSHTLFHIPVGLTDRLSSCCKGSKEGDHVKLKISLYTG